jgi:SAM-dependent methyltransferase
MPVAVSFALVATSSFATLVLELVAGRLLAPAVGVSLFTWTAIIGTVLGAIAVGNDLGGRLARLRSAPPVLETSLYVAATYIAALAALAGLLVIDDLAIGMPSLARLFLFVGVVGVVPCVLLGTTSPLVAHVTIALRGAADAGPIVGRLNAVATAASLIGAFGTGFLFVPFLGTRATLAMVAMLLAVVAPLANLNVGNRPRIVRQVVTTAAIVAGAAWAWAAAGTAHAAVVKSVEARQVALPGKPLPTGCLIESAYACIRLDWSTVGRIPYGRVRLDRSVQGQTAPEAPRLLSSQIAQALGDTIAMTSGAPSGSVMLPPMRILFIGGGSFTLPRWVEAVAPGSHLHVIEVDPEVTAVGTRWLRVALAAPPSDRFPGVPGVAVVHGDARRAIRSLPNGAYDVVIGDAFADMAVPWHLTTLEFTREVRRVLRPGGRYAVNVIDGWPGGRFLPAFLRTLQGAFTEVDALSTALPGFPKYDVVQNWVATAGDAPLAVASLEAMTRPGLTLEGTASAVPLRVRLVTRDGFAPAPGTDPDAPPWGDVARATLPLTDDLAPVDWYLGWRLAE